MNAMRLCKGGRWGLVAATLALLTAQAAAGEPPGEPKWFKGNIHTHSLWSDGDDFPEMVADWYKRNGYDFLSLTDHNILSRGAKWVRLTPKTAEALEKCKERFGEDWPATRGEGDKMAVRLRTLDELRKLLEEPGKFLLIEGQEVTTTVHLNVLNVDRVVKPQKGVDAVETTRLNVQAALDLEQAAGRPAYVQFNHPSFAAAGATAEQLAAVAELAAVEVANFHPACGAVERDWDIANSLRLNRGLLPLFGSAGDDAHNFHEDSPDRSNPGRGFVMVRSAELSADAIAAALKRGDFYASCGVILSRLDFDAKDATLHIEVKAEPGVEYTIEFIGTLDDADLAPKPGPDGAPPPPGRRRTYSPDIGKVLRRIQGASGSYKLTGRELYVRAAVRSNKPLANPSRNPPRTQEAYTQPVGWEQLAQ